ncbi:MAG TPA: hypothetical protein P5338_06300, partial [Bacteroidales bacterium]|nr:hypothetical protein [Bacteroidales bacterium]
MGISYQWGTSATPGGPYTNLGINPTQATGLITAPTYFICTITCSYSGLTYTTPEVIVSTKPNPTAVATSNSPVCPGDPIVFTGTTDIGTTFSWTGPDNFSSALQNPTIPVATNLSAGTYYFTATENGCPTTGSTIVVVKAAPANVTATASTNETCIGIPINLFSTSQNIQTYIDPNGDGGFESGTDFTSNGWTVSNSSNNPWLVGTGVTNASFINRSAYISNDNGVTNNFSNSSIALNYFYRDITIQSGDTDIKLKFDWMCNGESSWDLIQVFTAPTSVVPVATTTYPGSGTSNVPSGIAGATFVGSYHLQTTVQNAILTLPNALAGTTFRLIFAWKNDGSGGTAPAGSIDNISLTSLGSSASYSWTSVPPGFTSSVQNPTAVNVSVPTTYTVTVSNSTGCFTSASTSVSIVTGASITTHPVSLAICNGENATFSVAATGPGLTYQWRKFGMNIDPLLNPSATTTTLVINGATTADAGAYDVVVSASCGAPVSSNMVVLTVKPVPTALAANNTPICENTTIMLTGTTDIGNEFLWTGPNGFTSTIQNPTIANAALAAAGTYTFKTVLNGCTSLVSNTMALLNPMPVFSAVTAIPGSICPGETANLSAAVVTEQTADKYLFSAGTGAVLDLMTGATSVLTSGNDDTPTPAAAPIGFTFNFEGVDYTNYSVSPDGWLLLGNTTAASQYSNSVTSSTNIPKIYPYWDDVATGTDGNVKTLVTGSAPNRIFIVQWFVTIPRNTTGPANSTFQLWLYETSNKIEFMYGTMGAGAMSSSAGITGSNTAKYQSITLATGTSSISAPNDNNAGQPVPGTIYTFLPPPQTSGFAWTPAASVVSPLLPATATNPLSSTTTFTVTATGANNCINSQNVTVTVNPLPTATTTLNATEHICLGETIPLTVDLTGTAPWTLTVNDGTGSAVIPGILTSPWTFPASPTVNTTYTVTQVQDANCTNTSNLSVQVIVDPLPAPVVLTGVVTPLCANSTTTLDAGSGYTTYKWSDNSTAQTLLVDGNVLGGNATANYSVTVTNTFGCEATASTTITTYPTFTANAGTDVSVCPGSSTPLDANGIGGGGTYIQYDWSPAAGLSAVNIKNPVATPAVTTTYTVTVTDNNNCTAIDDVVVTVYPSVVVDFTGLNPDYCIDAPVATLTGSPAGGTFSGPGIAGNTFDPALATVGGPYTITYTYTDVNNCVWVITKPVTVNALPLVSFTGLNNAYCVDAGISSLTGIPAGGNFSGPGIAGSTFVTFNPAAAGVGGPYTITYVYTDGNGCVNSTTGQVSVYVLPVVSFSGLNAAYCIDAAAATLTGSPAGGTFSGAGITGTTFTPSVAGTGTHSITYTYTDGNSCTNSTSQNVTVNPLPVLNVTPIATSYCIDAGAVTLVGTPAGGVWSGPGVTGSQFVPALALAGNHTLMFSYTDGNGCSNSTTISTVVYDLPLVSFATPAPVCENAVPFPMYGGTPVGGIYTGPATVTSVFYPASAGAGSHLLTYTYTDGNNCTNSATASILVNALTPLTFPALAGVCVDAAPFAMNTALPAGGTYSGPGVSSNIFNPATAGVGIHTLTYTYTDGNVCTNTITQTIEVFALPVLTMSPAAVICEGTSTNISATATGAGGFTYVWNNAVSLSDPNIANPVATPGATTTYTVVVTDVNLCTQTGTVAITVNPLPVFIMNPAAVDLCLGGSAQIGVDGNLAGYSFLWDNASTLNNATISWPLANPTVTTTYTVTVTNTATSCQKTGSMVVTVLPNPAPVINGVNANYCKDAPAVVLSGTPAGGQFFIDNVAVTTLDASTLALGGHQVVYWFTHPNNCQNSATQSFTVRPLPVANAGADQNTCAGLPVL